MTTFVSAGLDNKKRKLFGCFDNGFCFPNCENVLLYNYLKKTCAYFLQLPKSLFNTEGVTSYKSVKLSTTICHSRRQSKTFNRSLVINQHHNYNFPKRTELNPSTPKGDTMGSKFKINPKFYSVQNKNISNTTKVLLRRFSFEWSHTRISSAD